MTTTERAALRHLVRHQGLTYHGTSDLTGLNGQLASRDRPEMERDDVCADVELSRSTATRRRTPDPAGHVDLAFGWYMHGIFD